MGRRAAASSSLVDETLARDAGGRGQPREPEHGVRKVMNLGIGGVSMVRERVVRLECHRPAAAAAGWWALGPASCHGPGKVMAWMTGREREREAGRVSE